MKKTVKKSITIFLAVLMLLSECINVFAQPFSEDESVSESEEVTVYDENQLGDVNGDGKVNASDARILLRCSALVEKPTERVMTYGDYNKDGEITAADARTALRVSASVETIYCILNGHELASLTVRPNCTDEGYTTQKCIRCAYNDGSKTDVVAASGHKLVKTSTKATCTAAGVFTSCCSVCGHVAENYQTAASLGHSYSGWKESDKTKSRICKRCGFTESVKTDPNSKKTVYLTFDDGPGPYTERLLGILRKYDVKATFFVTNQSPKYIGLLSTMVKDGHSIGVHSLTHNWSIYSGKSSFMKDFNAMHKIIEDETGIDTKLFRFPGGTNNTVSRKYSKGIMAELSSSLTNAGYVYFDWNVDSGDASGNGTSAIISTVKSQMKNRKNSIVLMHDTKKATVNAIEDIIVYGLKNGYEFKALTEYSPTVRFKPVN